MTDTTERRLKLLNMEGLGFSRAEIMKELSVKANVSRRAVYKDFESRHKWQRLLTADREVYRVVNLYEKIYKKAAYKYLSSGNESIQLGSLRIMLDVAKQLHEILVLPELMERLSNLEEKAGKGVFVK